MPVPTITLLQGPVALPYPPRTWMPNGGTSIAGNNGPYVSPNNANRKAIICASGIFGGATNLTALVTSDGGATWSTVLGPTISTNSLSYSGLGNSALYTNKIYTFANLNTVDQVALVSFDLDALSFSVVNSVIGTYVSSGPTDLQNGCIMAINNAGYGIGWINSVGGNQLVPFDVTGATFGQGIIASPTASGAAMYGVETVTDDIVYVGPTPLFFTPVIRRWATGAAFNAYTDSSPALDNATLPLTTQFMNQISPSSGPNALRTFYANLASDLYTDFFETIEPVPPPSVYSYNCAAPNNPNILSLGGYSFVLFPSVDAVVGGICNLFVTSRDESVPAVAVSPWVPLSLYSTPLVDEALLPFSSYLGGISVAVEASTLTSKTVGVITSNALAGSGDGDAPFWYWQVLIGTNSGPTLACPLNATITLNSTYTGDMITTGGTGPFTYSLIAGPAWLSINPTTGVVTGTPPATGSYSYTVQVTDSAALSATATCSLTVTSNSGNRKPPVFFPNPYDLCLVREYMLYRCIDYTFLSCGKKPACFNYDEREWGTLRQ